MYGFRHIRFFFVNIFFIVLALSGCRKEEDTSPPLITLQAPSTNANFQLPITIPVMARIEDDRKIKSIQVQLLNSNNTPVASTEVQANGETIQNISKSIDVQDLESGTYYIRIKASDGFSHTSKYVNIQLQSVPRHWQKTVVATGSSFNLSLHELTQVSGTFSLWQQLNIPLLEMDRLPDSKSLVVMSDHPYGVRFLDPVYGTDQFTVPSIQQIGGPSFTLLKKDPEEDLIWIGSHTGVLQAFNSSGQAVHSFTLHNSHRAICLERYNDLLILGEQNPGGSTFHLSVYFLSSGTLKSTRQINFEPIYIKSINSSTVRLYGYQGTETFSGQYDFRSDDLSPLSLFHHTKLRAFTNYQLTTYCLDNSAVWEIDPLANSLMSFAACNSCMDVEIEEVSRGLWIAGTFQLNYFSQGGSLLNSFTFSDTIRAVTCVYNK